MKPVYGEAPLIGYAVSIDDLRLDYELYKALYEASGNGGTMQPRQIQRYADLKSIFEGEPNGKA